MERGSILAGLGCMGRWEGVVEEYGLRFYGRKAVPYARLTAEGYVPLVTAFGAFKEGQERYFELLRRAVGEGVNADG